MSARRIQAWRFTIQESGQACCKPELLSGHGWLSASSRLTRSTFACSFTKALHPPATVLLAIDRRALADTAVSRNAFDPVQSTW